MNAVIQIILGCIIFMSLIVGASAIKIFLWK